MFVYFNNRLIVVETNLDWAIPYWENRKRFNDKIRWVLA